MVHSTSIWMAALKCLGLEVTLCQEQTIAVAIQFDSRHDVLMGTLFLQHRAEAA
jgi:hypothetical protein